MSEYVLPLNGGPDGQAQGGEDSEKETKAADRWAGDADRKGRADGQGLAGPVGIRKPDVPGASE